VKEGLRIKPSLTAPPTATIDPLPAKGKNNEPKAYLSGSVDVGWMPF
jgi:hypothetical protein